MKILILITGGIAAHKLPSICSALKNRCDHEVRILTTEKALDFVTKDSLLYSSEILNNTYMAHIKATEWADKVVIVPATYNTINKIAIGIADNEVTSACAAIPMKTPKIIFPAMNTNMWEKEILQENLNVLLERGWCVVDPVYGKMACGTEGQGVLPNTKYIVKCVENIEQQKKVIINKCSDKDLWYSDKKYIGESFRVCQRKSDKFYFVDIDVHSDLWKNTSAAHTVFPILKEDCKVIYLKDINRKIKEI